MNICFLAMQLILLFILNLVVMIFVLSQVLLFFYISFLGFVVFFKYNFATSSLKKHIVLVLFQFINISRLVSWYKYLRRLIDLLSSYTNLPNPFSTSRKRHKISFLAEYSWFQFRVFLLLDRLPYQSLRFYFPHNLGENELILFSRVLALYEMQTASFRIWIRVVVFLSYDNRYIMSAFYILMLVFLKHVFHTFKLDFIHLVQHTRFKISEFFQLLWTSLSLFFIVKMMIYFLLFFLKKYLDFSCKF